MTFDEYTALFNAYKAAHPIQYHPTNYGGVASEVSGGGGPQDAGSYANDAADRQLAAEWIATLTPEQQADYAKATESKDAANAKSMPLMGLAGLATVGTLGLLNPAIMGGAGFGGTLGGAAASAAPGAATGAAPGLFNPAVDSQLFNAAAGITGADAAAAAVVPSGVNLVNAGGVMSTAPGLLTPSVFNAAADSQLANTQLGITGDMAAAAAKVPAGVNLSNAGGLMSTGIDYATQLPINSLNPTDSRLANGTQTTPPPGTTTPPPSTNWYDSVKDLLPAGALDALKAAGLIGGAIAGAKETPGETTTQQSKTDPRVDPYIYGDNGVLKQAQDWYLKNKTGVNPTMQQGWDTRLGLLTDPNNMAQLKAMQQKGFGLLSNPIASNPWLKG